jgi:hypothetical protein
MALPERSRYAHFPMSSAAELLAIPEPERFHEVIDGEREPGT